MTLQEWAGQGGRSGADPALQQLTAALDHLVRTLVDGALDELEDSALVDFLQGFEQLRNRLSLVDNLAIGNAEGRGLPGTLSQPSMRQVLIQLLRLAPAEASRRVKAAEVCSERTSRLGEVLAPVRPHLADAQREGLVSPEQVQIIDQALTKVDRPGFDRREIAAAERSLTEFATTFGSRDLRHVAERTVEAIDPDGSRPDCQVTSDRRNFSLRRCRDGMYAGDFRLTGVTGAKLAALLGPLSLPRVDPADRGEGTSQPKGAVTARTAWEVDRRTFGQRSHDALEELCDRVLASGTVLGTGGTPATVIVTVDLEDLLQRTGHGTTSDGTRLPVAEVLRMAHEAEVIPTVMNRAGAVLALGRTRRIASHAQTLALIARDHGCSFPACDRAPEACERHHIVEWIAGGRTDLSNLTLLCRYHHHNFAGRGWTCRMSDAGLPEWYPPRWLADDQRPLSNSRIAAQVRRRPRDSRRRRSDPTTPGEPPDT